MLRIALGSFGSAGTALTAAWLLVVGGVDLPVALFLFVALACCLLVLAGSLIRRIHGGSQRVVAGVGLLVLLLPITVVIGASVSAFVNDVRLSEFAKQLFEHPLPRGTSRVVASSEVGVLTGNGDHCDFIARLQLESALPAEALRAHYGTLELRPAIPGGAGGGLPSIEVSAVPSAGAGRFVIKATDAPYEGIFDIRCM